MLQLKAALTTVFVLFYIDISDLLVFYTPVRNAPPPRGVLRDNAKNGCEADYWLVSFATVLVGRSVAWRP